jgi:aryl-alcohol dehydrogenase-like predicted oxidoreductase
MESRNLGTHGLSVAAIGLGCMAMTHAFGTRDDAESIKAIHRVLDAGVTVLVTAQVYGPHTNEELVGKAIRGRRAHQVHPISAVQSEYSLWEPGIEVAVLAGNTRTRHRLGSIHPSGPGFLTGGAIRSIYGMTARDFRRNSCALPMTTSPLTNGSWTC